MKSQIVVIDDEDRLRANLVEALEYQGYAARSYGSAEAFLADEGRPFDLMILDIMMPRMDGVELCATWRRRGGREPIIFLSGKSSDFDKVHALESGGDDYLTKPYSMIELLCRVRVALRRREGYAATGDDGGGLFFDHDNWRCRLDGVEMPLTVSEFRILSAISTHRKKVYERDELMRLAYPDDPYISDRNADAHIKRIRKKLKDAGGSEAMIQTVYGVGYRFEFP